jgi:hypothetical protein
MLRNAAVIVSVLVLVLVLSAGTCSQRVLAQKDDVPNLTGTWELVEFNGSKKSWGDPHFTKMTLVIRHEGPELKITRKRIRDSRNKAINGTEEVREFIHHTDGQVDYNLGRVDLWFDESIRYESVTRLSENKILTEFKQALVMAPSRGLGPKGPIATTNTVSSFKEEWSLDKAGNRLVMNFSEISMNSAIITDHDGGRPPSAEWGRLKFVFRKVP